MNRFDPHTLGEATTPLPLLAGGGLGNFSLVDPRRLEWLFHVPLSICFEDAARTHGSLIEEGLHLHNVSKYIYIYPKQRYHLLVLLPTHRALLHRAIASEHFAKAMSYSYYNASHPSHPDYLPPMPATATYSSNKNAYVVRPNPAYFQPRPAQQMSYAPQPQRAQQTRTQQTYRRDDDDCCDCCDC